MILIRVYVFRAQIKGRVCYPVHPTPQPSHWDHQPTLLKTSPIKSHRTPNEPVFISVATDNLNEYTWAYLVFTRAQFINHLSSSSPRVPCGVGATLMTFHHSLHYLVSTLYLRLICAHLSIRLVLVPLCFFFFY